MKQNLLALMAFAIATLNMQAQPPADSTPTYPQGATYTHSSGTATITDSYSSSTQYYNVIQCTGGTLTMNGCTITKNGYTLTYSSLSGSGTINETTGIEEVRSRKSDGRGDMYTLDGRRANASVKGIVIQDGKKVVRK